MINDLKDLQKLFKLCRAQGVTEITLGTTAIKFGEMPSDVNLARANNSIEETDRYAGFPDGFLTEEQLMFYSAGGDPKDDPALKKEISA